MGDIADAYLEGLFCRNCGEFLGGDAPGHPRACAGCDGYHEDEDIALLADVRPPASEGHETEDER